MCKWLALVSILFCGAAHAQAPSCGPGQYPPNVNWQVSVASDATIVTLLWCYEADVGLTWFFAGWDPIAAPVNACAGKISRSSSVLTLMAAFWSNCLAGAGQLTIPQTQAAQALQALWLPVLQTTKQEQVLFVDNGVESGTEEISAGATCGITAVPVNNNRSTNWYSVAGQTAVDGTTLPSDAVARCSIIYPPVSGWPQ